MTNPPGHEPVQTRGVRQAVHAAARWPRGSGAGPRWFRRILAGLVLLTVLSWIAVPVAVKHFAQERVSEVVGRPFRIGAVHFNPLTFTLSLDDVALAGPRPGLPDAIAFKHFEIALRWRTLWVGAPVAKAALLQSLRVHVARTAPGRFDWDDIVSRLLERKTERGHVLHWALYNLQLEDGRIEFDDQPVGRRHVVEQLTLGVPFASTLPADEEITVQPHLAFILDGAHFDSLTEATPFHLDRTGTLQLHTGAISLAPWLPYWPSALGWRPTKGELKVDATLSFTRPPQGGPRWSLGGELRVADFAIVDKAGQPLVGWRSLGVELREIEPFRHEAAVRRVALDGLDVALDRDAQGRLNLLRAAEVAPAAPASVPVSARASAPVAAAASPTASGSASASASAPKPADADADEDTPAPPWTVAVDAVEFDGARVSWRDAAVTPAAAYVLEDLRLRMADVHWPLPPGPPAVAPGSAPASGAAPASMPVRLAEAAPGASRAASAPVPTPAASGAAPSAAEVARNGGVRFELQARWTSAVPAPASAPARAAAGAARVAAGHHRAGAASAPSGPASAAARMPAAGASAAAPGVVEIAGRLGAQRSEMDVALDRFPIASLRPYLARFWAPATAGELSTRARARWAGPLGQALPTIAFARLGIDELRLQEAGRTEPAAAWSRAQVDGLQLDLPGHRVELGSVELVRPEFWVERDAAGTLNVQRWAAPAGEAASSPGAAATASAPVPASPPGPASTPATGGPGWQTRIGRAAITDGRLHWRDAPAAGPVALDVDALQFAVADLGFPGAAKSMTPLKLRARVTPADRSAAAGAGQLEFDGRIGLSPIAWSGRLRAERLPLHSLDAYLASASPLLLLHADVGWRGQLEGSLDKGLKLKARGDALLTDLHARARYTPDAAAGGEDLLSWQSLSVSGADVSIAPARPPVIVVGDVKLASAFARLVVTEEGRFNLADLAPPAAAGSAAAPAAAHAPAPASAVAAASAPEGPLPDIRVGSIELSDSRVQYTDRFIKPNYSADLSGLAGTLGAFSTRAPDLAPLQLRGLVEGTGQLDVQGKLNPLARPLALDVRARASDIELAPLSPYAGKYAGYNIERGKLSMNVHYQVQPDGHLEASNQIILNQLTFGEKVDSPSATKLPVLFAVALLKDRNGVIDVNLPIGGSLNDPKFSVGGIIFKLIINLLTKALTAPFALLAGGGEQDLSQVLFVSGTAKLQEGSDKALDKVAKALDDRPGLHLTITGLADDDQEHADMQAANLDARLVGLRRTELLQSGQADVPAAPPLTPEDRTRLVKRLYADTKLKDKPRNVVGIAKDIPQAEMETRLKEGLPLPADAARQLAVQRAQVVRDALAARGLSNERMFVASPKVHGAGSAEPEEWLPHAQLELSAR
jgi:uncharacterized protein involved in outer membrane biogenesis